MYAISDIETLDCDVIFSWVREWITFLHEMNVSITYTEDYQFVRGTRCEFMRTKFIQRQIQTKHIYITVFPTSETLKQLYKQEQVWNDYRVLIWKMEGS